MTSAKFELTYGSLSLFYGGLESLIGPPKMVAPRPGEPKTLMYALVANPNPNPNLNPNPNHNPITLTATRYALEAIRNPTPNPNPNPQPNYPNPN